MKILALLPALASVLLCASSGCRPGGEQRAGAENAGGGGAVVAKVGERHITLEELENELHRRARSQPGPYPSEGQRRQVLEEMIQFQVLLARAKSAGFDRRPDIQAQVEQYIVSRFQEDEFARQAEPGAPSDAALRGFYDQRREQFTTPESVRTAVIFFKLSTKAEADRRATVRRRAEEVLELARARDAAGFGQLAQQYSEDQATRYAGGDAGWFTREAGSHRWPDALVLAAFAIAEIGQCAPLLEAPEGLYIVRLTDRKTGGVRSFEEVREVVAYQFDREQQQQRQTAFLEVMRRDIPVTIYPEVLKRISVPSPSVETKPPALPGG